MAAKFNIGDRVKIKGSDKNDSYLVLYWVKTTGAGYFYDIKLDEPWNYGGRITRRISENELILIEPKEKYEEDDIMWYESAKSKFEIGDIVKHRFFEGTYEIVRIDPSYKIVKIYQLIRKSEGKTWSPRILNAAEEKLIPTKIESYGDEDIQWFEAMQKKDWGFKIGDLVTYKIYPGTFRIIKRKYDRMRQDMCYTLKNIDEKNDFELSYVRSRNIKLINNYKDEDIQWFESKTGSFNKVLVPNINEKFKYGDIVLYMGVEYSVVGVVQKMDSLNYSLYKRNPKSKDGMPINVVVSEVYLDLVPDQKIEKYKEDDIEWFESKINEKKMNNLKTFEDFTNEESDYRNVTGYGSMGSPGEQNSGPSFNKGPDAATYNRPDVIGVETDYIEDPYFAISKEQRKKRSRKPKYIERLRRDKSKYLNKLDKNTNILKESTDEENRINICEMWKEKGLDYTVDYLNNLLKDNNVWLYAITHNYTTRKLTEKKFKIFKVGKNKYEDPYQETIDFEFQGRETDAIAGMVEMGFSLDSFNWKSLSDKKKYVYYKPKKIVISKEDPLGEEDWDD